MLTLLLALTACQPDKPVDTAPSTPADVDGDGFAAPDDCNDDDASVHPDAAEVCGGGDEDCDGLVDEADPDLDTRGYAGFLDEDGDGFGTGDEVVDCAAPLAPAAGDCNDANPDMNPGALALAALGGDCDDADALQPAAWARTHRPRSPGAKGPWTGRDPPVSPSPRRHGAHGGSARRVHANAETHVAAASRSEEGPRWPVRMGDEAAKAPPC